MIIHQIPEEFERLGIELADTRLAMGKIFPDFLIIGPWRTGTTWLSEMLRLHPQCVMSEPKEPLYFSGLTSKGKKASPRDLMWYLSLFQHAGERICGEASATYALHLHEDMIRWILAVNPDIRIIMGIRHPVDRAWSHMKMNLQLEVEEFAQLTTRARHNKLLSRDYILRAGYFSELLDKWLRYVPSEQMHMFHFDMLQADPVSAIADVCRFLHIESDKTLIRSLVAQVGNVAQTKASQMPRRVRRHLESAYHEEVALLHQKYGTLSMDTAGRSGAKRPVVLIPGEKLNYSETFIENHINCLNAKKVGLVAFLPVAVRMHGPPVRDLVRRILSARNRRRLRNTIEDAGGSVLIEFGTTAAAALPVLRALRQRIAIYFHGFDMYKTDVLDRNIAAYRELFDIADALIVVSRHMRDKLAALGAPPKKIHHIVCGVDPALFPCVDVSANPPLFFGCGRFVEKKAPHLTIAAFHRAFQQDPHIRLCLAGDGPLFQKCADMVRDLGLRDVIDLPGAIDHKVVAATLQRCRAFVQHSVTTADGDSEGTPVGILEAGMSGVPVIATRHMGIMDVVTDGETGILVDEGDAAAMAQAILQLSQAPQYSADLGMRAHEHIKSHYALDDTIAQLRTLLHIRAQQHQIS